MSYFQANLAALREAAPHHSAAVEQASVPADYALTPGLDGTPTYARIVPAPAKRVDWLGGVSTPRAAAAAIINALNPGESNGLGLSIGTGYEWLAFLAKLSRHQALYVYEPELSRLRMALEICDLSAVIARGKLVLLAGPGAADDLSVFLAAHPGYEPPMVLHPLPTLAGPVRNALIAAGEAMVRRVVSERQAWVNDLAVRVPVESTSATLALLLTEAHAFERPLHQQLPRDSQTIRLDDHRACSLALRLQAFIAGRPGRIVSDLFRPQLEPVPTHVAVETWVPPLAGAGYWRPERLPTVHAWPGQDRIVVHFEDHRALLKAHGIPESQIHLVPLAAMWHSALKEQNALSIRSKVAIIGDLPVIDPEAIGFKLPTQIAVYAVARQILEDEYLTANVSSVPGIFRRALSRAGIPATAAEHADPAFIGPMQEAIRHVLLPAIPLLSMARMLVENQIALKLIGDWSPALAHFALPSQGVSRAGFPAMTEVEELFGDVAVVVHLSPTGAFSPLELAAPSCGVPLVAVAHASDALAGSLPQVLQAEAQFAHPRANQLLPTLKALLRDSGKRLALAQAAAEALYPRNAGK